jgi:dTDP-4-amino-4,6-dideoxygalactose transaminase
VKFKSEKDRDRTKGCLERNGIPSMIYYARPLHKQEAFEQLEKHTIGLENVEKLCKKVLSLPIHPYMKTYDVMQIIDVLKMVDI